MALWLILGMRMLCYYRQHHSCYYLKVILAFTSSSWLDPVGWGLFLPRLSKCRSQKCLSVIGSVTWKEEDAAAGVTNGITTPLRVTPSALCNIRAKMVTICCAAGFWTHLTSVVSAKMHPLILFSLPPLSLCCLVRKEDFRHSYTCTHTSTHAHTLALSHRTVYNGDLLCCRDYGVCIIHPDESIQSCHAP
jgi:hypothetical protein